MASAMACSAGASVGAMVSSHWPRASSGSAAASTIVRPATVTVRASGRRRVPAQSGQVSVSRRSSSLSRYSGSWMCSA